MRRCRQLQGLVLDDATEQPVTRFGVRTGQASPDGSDVYGIIRNRDFSAVDGVFTMALEEESDNALVVYADGYSDQVQKFPEAQNGTVQMTVRLKQSASLSGVVLTPDGAPAPGVKVAAVSATSHSFIQLSAGHLRSVDSHTKIATTDGEGQFKIPSADEDGTVVAAGDPGFARAPMAEVRSTGSITLQTWGRIEGTLKIGGQPGADKDLLFNLTIPGIATDFNGYKATTDDQGQFSFEKVPPGDGAVVRLIRTAPSSWTHSDSTPVTVQPGQTTQVALGDTGALLVGKIRFDTPPTNATALSFEGNLSTSMPQMPAFNSSDEAQTYLKSPEFQALSKLRKHYAIETKADGSFTVENVAPGVYSLIISARLRSQRPWEHPPVAQGSAQITVPDSFNPAWPVDVGEVILKPSSQSIAN